MKSGSYQNVPETPIRCFSVSVVALREMPEGPEVLLLRRTDTLKGEWCQIAGGIENDESAWRAALRELGEETGLTPSAFFSADIFEQFYKVDRDAISLVPVFVAFIEGDAEVVLNHEHSDYCWVPFDKAIKMVPFAGQRHVLRHIESEFVEAEPNQNLRIEI